MRGGLVSLQLHFHADRVRLADLAKEFGSWYRDPPDGEVSFASAHFNATSISSQSRFLMGAVFPEYSKAIRSDSFAEQLYVTYRDDRYVRASPW